MKVNSFVDHLIVWQKYGYVSPLVWLEMGNYIRSELLPGDDITQAPSMSHERTTTAAAAPSGGEPQSLDQKR